MWISTLVFFRVKNDLNILHKFTKLESEQWAKAVELHSGKCLSLEAKCVINLNLFHSVLLHSVPFIPLLFASCFSYNLFGSSLMQYQTSRQNAYRFHTHTHMFWQFAFWHHDHRGSTSSEMCWVIGFLALKVGLHTFQREALILLVLTR